MNAYWPAHEGWVTIALATLNQLHARNSSSPSQRYILLDNVRLHWQHGQPREIWQDRPAPWADWAFVDLRPVFTAELISHSRELTTQAPFAQVKSINSIIHTMELLCCSQSSAPPCGS
jgi:hypothetical protein